MKISVVTPSYNQSSFLARTLESVISQEGDFDLEHLVVDGGSTDGSLDVLREFEHRYQLANRRELRWTSQRDNGQAAAINFGFMRASGDVVAFLNSDDTYAPGALRCAAETFAQNPRARWLTGFCRIIDADDIPIQTYIVRYKNFWLRRYSYQSLTILNYIAQPATFWLRQVLDEDGVLDERLHFTFDYDFWLRLGRNCAPVVVPQFLANFRIHGSSKGGTRFCEQFDEEVTVAKRYTNSNITLLLHRLHNTLIVFVYRLLK